MSLALPEIPVLEAGSEWPVKTLEIAIQQAHALLDEAAAGHPTIALMLGDAISRRWLKRWQSPHLTEIDRISARIGRPGAHYFNTCYEWGCTTSSGPCPSHQSARIMRVLDWPYPGLGRNLVAVRVAGDAGPWVTLTWPGYTGVLQAMAPGRFAAALNQAPMDQSIGFLPMDWAINRSRVWRSPHLTPAHLLRHVFETSESYNEAKQLLTTAPISAPTIYTLSGVAPEDTCVIERKEYQAHVIEGPASAANDWQRPGWNGRVRGEANDQRREIMAGCVRELNDSFAWLQPPVRNELTRLALVADAAEGRLVAQGHEAHGPATQVLSLEG